MGGSHEHLKEKIKQSQAKLINSAKKKKGSFVLKSSALSLPKSSMVALDFNEKDKYYALL